MRYTVVWTAAAERELTALWLASRSRYLVSLASNEIDEMLAQGAESVGESREEDFRIAFVPPLIIEFEVVEKDRIVLVHGVWD